MIMKSCSYCGAEYPDDAVMCVTDHTPLAGTPALFSREFIKDWSPVRSTVRLFSVCLMGISLPTTWLMLWAGKLETPEQLANVLWQDRFNAIPMPFAVFLLVLTLPRPRVWIRAALAILVGFVLWFYVWQWLDRCDNGQFPGAHVGASPGPGLIPMGLILDFILAAIPTFLVQLLLVCSLRAAGRIKADKYDAPFCLLGSLLMWCWAVFLFFGGNDGVSLLLFLVGAAVCVVGTLARRKS